MLHLFIATLIVLVVLSSIGFVTLWCCASTRVRRRRVLRLQEQQSLEQCHHEQALLEQHAIQLHLQAALQDLSRLEGIMHYSVQVPIGELRLLAELRFAQQEKLEMLVTMAEDQRVTTAEVALVQQDNQRLWGLYLRALTLTH